MRDEQIPTMNKSKKHDEISLHESVADRGLKTFSTEGWGEHISKNTHSSGT